MYGYLYLLVPLPDFNVLTTAGSGYGEEEEDAILPRSHKALDDESLRRRTATTTPPLPHPGPTADTTPGVSTSPQDLEAQGEKEGAFNPDTGEINWDCPCLGGMAHGPCAGEFRSAFSCFVYSTAEPKGVDCIEKFKTMQDCFRKVFNPLPTIILITPHFLFPPPHLQKFK